LFISQGSHTVARPFRAKENVLKFFASFFQERRLFFSEEKKQKTFVRFGMTGMARSGISLLAGRRGAGHCADQIIRSNGSPARMVVPLDMPGMSEKPFDATTMIVDPCSNQPIS
jgi:hypothetical protein